ncbi:uncharacterized protein JCM15063_006583 [Sporobolomyces koalae]|uniref:uncharacterized protein n=1 Tax=Sporobolomyces koalae TaxID=500713 RepID=UPI00316CE77B
MPPSNSDGRVHALEEQRLTVIGGGSGCNHILGPLQDTSKTTFVVPVSDDGGSTAEILRVLGGPALGDIRSRLVRLIPPSPIDSPLFCIRRLFEYRLPSSGTAYEIKGEWHSIVEGVHRLWKGIPGDRKETIRAFLVYFEGAVLKKAQRGFNFRKASIGNLFLSGASLFLGSVPSAIFLFASLTGIPHERFAVVPVINTSSTVTIAAELENGAIIAGQSEISHPAPTVEPKLGALPTLEDQLMTSPPSGKTHLPLPLVNTYFPLTRATTPSFPEPPVLGAEEDDDARPMDSPETNSWSFPREQDKSRNIEFSKDSNANVPLEARIRRIFYLNAFGHEIFPRPNGIFLESLQHSTALIYAPGSLYTSILPCVALHSVGTRIAQSPNLRHKILLLNSEWDRETPEYTSLDFVKAISSACNRAYGDDPTTKQTFEPRDFVTHVVYMPQAQVTIQIEELESLGIKVVKAESNTTGSFEDQNVRQALSRIFAGEV